MSHLKQCLYLLAVLGAIALFACLGLYVWVDQSLSSPVLLTLESPARNGAAIWLIAEGFQDRGITLYAKPSGHRAQRVTPLDWHPLYRFLSAQWTRDGQVAVFRVQVPVGTNAPVVGFAFDFQSNAPVLPAWQSAVSTTARSLADWKQQEAAILKLVSAHGGLAPERIEREVMQRQGKSIWFWQVPSAAGVPKP